MASSPTRKRSTLARGVSSATRCETHKIGYSTYEAALEGAERQMERGKVSPGCHITPYQCDLGCGQWHLANRRIVFGIPSDNLSVGFRG